MLSKNIVWRLTGYFMITMIFLVLLVGSLFLLLIVQHNKQVNQEALLMRGQSIAETVSEFLVDETQRNKSGFGAYMKLVDDVALAQVWIVNQDNEIITTHTSRSLGQSHNYFQPLPDYASQILESTSVGKVVITSKVVSGEEQLIIGIPVYSNDQEYIGSVLLSSPVSDFESVLNTSMLILTISFAFGLVVTFFLGLYFSRVFTKPLMKIRETTLSLASGDYDARSNIKSQDEIASLANDIDNLAIKLKSASEKESKLEQLRNNFIANISHELRTPVTVIRGSLEALLDNVITESAQVELYHNQMLKETIFLQKLITDLLELSKLENSEFSIDMEKVNLVEIVNDTILSFKLLAKKKSLNIKFESDTNLYMINGDYDRLKQLISILLDNAIKFSLSEKEVKIKLYANGLSIFNYGSLLTDEQINNMFLRFQQVRNETNKQGSGLGLSIAQEIAKRHNAVISAQNLEDGVQFIVKLPPKI